MATCVNVSEKILKKILDEPPLNNLPGPVLARLRSLLPRKGKVCLSASTSGVQCQAGTREKPKIQKCCKFGEPKAELFDIPKKIKFTIGVAPVVGGVDLKLKGELYDVENDNRCSPPECKNETIKAKAKLVVEGSVNIPPTTVEVAIEWDLEQPLTKRCTHK